MDEEQRALARSRNFLTAFDGVRFEDGYRNIPIFAAPGLHEAAAARIGALLDAGAHVLELGAGAGALSLRLADLGYRVTASDLDAARFQAGDAVEFRAFDLNRTFAERFDRRFSGIVALELIEHLENPHQFMRECAKLLSPGGVLTLSTPNVLNPVSLALQIREGYPQWFRDADYREQGHITPVSRTQLDRMAAEAGLERVWEGSVSRPQRLLHRRHDRFLRRMSWWIARLGSLPESLAGEIYMAQYRLGDAGHGAI